MALNLSRNTRLFISDDVAGASNLNTFEIPILDGYSFSQDTASQTITLNEAGEAPTRGQKIFNTALNPVDFNFTTYVRPYLDTNVKCIEKFLWGAVASEDTFQAMSALGGSDHVKETATELRVDFEGSEKHQLKQFYLFFLVDNSTYRISGAQITSASVNFGIDEIASVQWTGQGTTLTEVTDTIDATTWTAGSQFTAYDTSANFIANKLTTMELVGKTAATPGSVSITYTGGLVLSDAHNLSDATTYEATVTVDGGAGQVISIDPAVETGVNTIQELIDFININLYGAYVTYDGENNALVITSSTAGTTSSVQVVDDVTNPLFDTLSAAATTVPGAAGTGTGTGTEYTVPITGGSLDIQNNITFLTPEELGVVNTPFTSFTGTRSISGSVTAYLRTGNDGTNNTGKLLEDLLNDTNSISQEFELNLAMGGGSNAVRVNFIMNHAHLVIPSVDVQDVVSTTINFTALGESLEIPDELVVEYHSD